MSHQQDNSLKESFSSQIIQQYPEQLKEECTCSICSSNYNLNDRYPINSCTDQHHACLRCLENLIKNKKDCPICKRPFEKGSINKNKVIGNLLFKSATKKGLKVQIMENPEQRIKKLLPQTLPNMASNNNIVQNNQIQRNNYNPPNILDVQPSTPINQSLNFPSNPNSPANNSNQQFNPSYPNGLGYNNYLNNQQYPVLNNKGGNGMLKKWQNKLKPKLQTKYKGLLLTSFAFLLIFQIFALLEIYAYNTKGYCFYSFYYKGYLMSGAPTLNTNNLLVSFITRTVFFILAIIFGLISVKVQTARYPALISYFVFLSIAFIIHSVYLVRQYQEYDKSRQVYEQFGTDFDYRLDQCLWNFSFLVQQFALIEGCLQIIIFAALNCALIVSMCINPTKYNAIH